MFLLDLRFGRQDVLLEDVQGRPEVDIRGEAYQWPKELSRCGCAGLRGVGHCTGGVWAGLH